MSIFYTKDGSYPQPIPHRIRMPNGSTRTDKDQISHQDMLDAGYTVAPNMPAGPKNEDHANWPVYEWDPETSNWVLKE